MTSESTNAFSRRTVLCTAAATGVAAAITTLSPAAARSSRSRPSKHATARQPRGSAR